MTRSRLLVAAFWLAALIALVMAALPHPPRLPIDPDDKVQHLIAFATLTVLAIAAFPKASWVRIIVGLSAFGVLIELVQAIPALHRDSDWQDWLADTVAALAILAVVLAVRRLRRR